MKKRKYGKLAVFLALLIVMVIGTMKWSASADAIPSDAVEVDYVNETITVRTDTDEVIYFTDVYNKDVSKWDACEVRERIEKDADGKVITDGNGDPVTYNAASFDISWLNTSKTVRLYLCGDVNKAVISKDITWEEDFAVSFTGTLLTTDITEAATWKQIYAAYPNFTEDTGYFLFTIEENGRDMSYFDLENIQWRKGDDGVWRKYDELDLKEMNIRGVSLEFRVVADNEEPFRRASSTAKITVSKLLSGPVITINTNAMTVGLKNGMEFSFDKENWFMIPDYSKKFGTETYVVDENTRELAIEEIYTNVKLAGMIMQDILKKSVATGFTMNTPMDEESLKRDYPTAFEYKDGEGIILYVRDLGTDRKAASKITEVIIPFADSNAAEANPDELLFSYGESKTNTGGIVVENKSLVKYQVGVITEEEYEKIKDYPDDLDLSNMKWTGISAGKMLKISNKKVPKGARLVFRIAGENGQLPSTYAISEPMLYDHITYAGIGTATMAVGQTLTAVPSTNFKELGDDGNYKNLIIQWQSSADKVEWENIATGSTFEMNDATGNKYIRVVITDNYGNSKTSDPVGPVKPAPTPKPEANPSPEPTP